MENNFRTVLHESVISGRKFPNCKKYKGKWYEPFQAENRRRWDNSKRKAKRHERWLKDFRNAITLETT